MKKTILFALIAMLVAVSCTEKKVSGSAEQKKEPVKIQREFLGVELGKTTVEEAKKMLALYYPEYRDGMIAMENVEFAGTKFTGAGIIFERGVAHMAGFMLSQKDYGSNLDFLISEYATRLSKKYGDPKDKKVNGWQTYTWGDDSTTVELMLFDNGGPTMKLTYTDTPLNADDDL